MVELTPEIKAQLKQQSEQCVFCHMVKGKQDATKVYEDSGILSVLDIQPLSEGHSLVMPKAHYPILPYVQEHDFKHLFGKMPALLTAYVKALKCDGCDVYIANGAAAGQQAPHVIVHILPYRGKSPVKFSGGNVEEDKVGQVKEMLQHNLTLMLQKNIVAKGGPQNKETSEIYADSIVDVTMAPELLSLGHLRIRLHKELRDMSQEEAAHVFYVASYAATAIFEGLGVQGTNIVYRSSENYVDVIGRYEGDGINMPWNAMAKIPNASGVRERLRKTLFVLEEQGKKKSIAVINYDEDAIREAIRLVKE